MDRNFDLFNQQNCQISPGQSPFKIHLPVCSKPYFSNSKAPLPLEDRDKHRTLYMGISPSPIFLLVRAITEISTVNWTPKHHPVCPLTFFFLTLKGFLNLLIIMAGTTITLHRPLTQGQYRGTYLGIKRQGWNMEPGTSGPELTFLIFTSLLILAG